MKKNTFLVSTQRLRMPARLVYCYRGNFSETWYPNSLSMVIDIIRKIEDAFPTSIDLRHLSARLFHELVNNNFFIHVKSVKSYLILDFINYGCFISDDKFVA